MVVVVMVVMGHWVLMITVSHPTFCCDGVGVVVEVGLGCDNMTFTFQIDLKT